MLKDKTGNRLLYYNRDPLAEHLCSIIARAKLIFHNYTVPTSLKLFLACQVKLITRSSCSSMYSLCSLKALPDLRSKPRRNSYCDRN